MQGFHSVDIATSSGGNYLAGQSREVYASSSSSLTWEWSCVSSSTITGSCVAGTDCPTTSRSLAQCKTDCQNSVASQFNYNENANLNQRSCHAINWNSGSGGSCYLMPYSNQHLYDSAGGWACVMTHEWFRDLSKTEDPAISLTHESYTDACSNSNMLYRGASLTSCTNTLVDHAGANVYIYNLSLIHI